MRKNPEPKENINTRSKRHRASKTTQKLEIVGLQPEDVEFFRNLPRLENCTHAEKLRELMKFWKQQKIAPFMMTLKPDLFKEEQESPQLEKKKARIGLFVRVENNSKFVRGKSKARREIEDYVLSYYNIKKKEKDGSEYELTIPYSTDEDLDHIIENIGRDMWLAADDRNCFIEADFWDLDSDKTW